MISKDKRLMILISPLAIIFLGFLTAFLFSKYIHEWAWIPLALVYWLSLGLCILYFKGTKHVKDWFLPTKITSLWNVISLLLGMIPLSILAMNYHLLDSTVLIVLWIVFALVNPWFEELYWRGLLLDATKEIFPKWISIVYSTFFYCISHPFMWGVFSIANTSYHLYIYLVLMGIIWSISYYKTNSLKWITVSHFIVDIGNLAVLCFLNIYIPPGIQ
ncbi:CPBP family intramembrane glutamic endopeptidase [Ureibacillus sp. MALMAid1270]|uniref:CPBP family intramembrane glutamic endopeptidase n=1 Tax=Ureibacillus sp. MALMAid1270 TaxID=3411629 RepID=UPI003BA4C929